MGLILSEEEQLLQESARSFLADNAPVSAFRELRKGGGDRRYDPTLWAAMTELGWPAIVVPESYGGLGFGYTGLGLIGMEVGRKLTASPLFATAGLGASALMLSDSESIREELLPKIAAGEVTVGSAIDVDEAPLAADTLRAVESGSGVKISGTLPFVADGTFADYLLVAIPNQEIRDGGQGVALIDLAAPNIERTAVGLIDSRSYARLEFHNADVDADCWLTTGRETAPVLELLRDIAATLISCELFGCLQAAFEQTIAHLKEREQFGRKLGSFQALQHRAAHALTRIELLKSVIFDALAAIDEDRVDRCIAASHAKAMANETAKLVLDEAIQMHGGMGITDEIDIGLYFKRARVLRTACGSTSYHRRRFADFSGF